MFVRFWGTRGSIPTPGPGTVRYGGNTSCVEVRSGSGTLLVLDCGTGARPLGRSLMEESAATGTALRGSILLGHTHWDHIQGLPFFEPLFQEGGRWDLYGPRGLGASLAQTMAGQMQYQYFPISLEQLGADVGYHDLVEGAFRIGDVTVRTQYLNHPALTLGYRIEVDGAVIVYLADHEPYDPGLAQGGDVNASAEDGRHVAFMEGADIVIHDAQYEASEYANRTGWGHSTMEYVVDAAIAAEVDRLVLYHHDPWRDDDALDALLDRARRRAGAVGTLQVDAAAEGMELRDRPVRTGSSPAGRRRTHATPSLPAATNPALEDLDVSVVVAVRDRALADVVVAAASEEQLRVLVTDPETVLADVVDRAGRTVLVIEADDARPLVEAAAEEVAPSVWSRLAVLAVARTIPTAAVAPSVVTDWVVWPATRTHVRTKLRAAVLRRACRWLAAPLPRDEGRRLRALRALGLLDTPAEERFDRYTEEACRTLGVPVALVTLVDEDRQWFKARRGLTVTETPRDQSICAHAILGADVLQVPDLLEDPRFADSPPMSADGRIRFYAGAPLVLDDGARVGTLCVADHRPRILDDRQLDVLRELARHVATELQAGDPAQAPAAG